MPQRERSLPDAGALPSCISLIQENHMAQTQRDKGQTGQTQDKNRQRQDDQDDMNSGRSTPGAGGGMPQREQDQQKKRESGDPLQEKNPNPQGDTSRDQQKRNLP
jgi:hypothetical protein